MERFARARTWSEFLEFVRYGRLEIGNPETVWYRGHSDVTYKLIPSLNRHPDGLKVERPLFDEYQKSAARLHAPRSNDWQLLFDMQHYGLPTRLLDWTTVLGVAITFALYDGRDSEDSAIYLLNPISLNRLSGIDEVRRVPGDSEKFGYKDIYWRGTPFKAIYPIAIDSEFQNDRLAAQNGTFTVHGTEPEPFDGAAREYVFKLILASEAKPEAREFLQHANLNAFSIYPDMVGMTRHLKTKYFPR